MERCGDCAFWELLKGWNQDKKRPNTIGQCSAVKDSVDSGSQIPTEGAGATCHYPWACEGHFWTHIAFGCTLFQKRLPLAD